MPVSFIPFPVRTELPLHLAHASGPLPAVRADALSSCELITQSFMGVSGKTFHLCLRRTAEDSTLSRLEQCHNEGSPGPPPRKEALLRDGRMTSALWTFSGSSSRQEHALSASKSWPGGDSLCLNLACVPDGGRLLGAVPACRDPPYCPLGSRSP